MILENLPALPPFKYKDIWWEAIRFGCDGMSPNVDKFVRHVNDWLTRNKLNGLSEIEVKYEMYHGAYHPKFLRFSVPLYTKQEHEIFKDYYQKTHEVAGVLLRPGSFFVAEAHQRINPRWAVIHENNADKFYDEIIRPGTDFEL